MREIVFIALFTVVSNAAFAQATSGAVSQTITMATGDAVEITFTGSGDATGSSVALAFNSVNDYADGVTSTAQEIKIVSNKNFTVAVKANATNFTYSGASSPAPTMPVGVLALKIASNATGGTVASPFSMSGFAPLSSVSQNIIDNGALGTNQLFSVQYKATPGFAYPAGTYTADILFTATQL